MKEEIEKMLERARKEHKECMRARIPTGYWEGQIDVCLKVLKILNNQNYE